MFAEHTLGLPDYLYTYRVILGSHYSFREPRLQKGPIHCLRNVCGENPGVMNSAFHLSRLKSLIYYIWH